MIYPHLIRHLIFLQWNLYKATIEFCGLSRQVVFHGRENKHDLVKTVPGKWWNLCVLSKTFPVVLYRFHCVTFQVCTCLLWMVAWATLLAPGSVTSVPRGSIDGRSTCRITSANIQRISQIKVWLGHIGLIQYLGLCVNSYPPGQYGRHFTDNIFRCIFVNEVLYFDSNFTEICSQGSNWQLPSTGSDNGLASNRRQAIIWTSADPIDWLVYVALRGDELTEGWENSPLILPTASQIFSTRGIACQILHKSIRLAASSLTWTCLHAWQVCWIFW